MDAEALDEAVALLVAVRRGGALIDALPAASRPVDLSEAHAIQDAVSARLGEPVGGWKAALLDGELMRGPLYASRLLASPARLPADRMPMRGIEAEIAFRVERDLAPRARDYSYDEVARAVTALAAIEIVDTRFRDYHATAVLDRAADCVSNGGLVLGAPRPDWRDFDLARLEVVLTIGGATVLRRVGGHAAGDPLLPAVALANSLRTAGGLKAGQTVTTGTFSGLEVAAPGQTVTVEFTGFGAAEVVFEA
jgi:2-keto-4-pentenoate hydratase